MAKRILKNNLINLSDIDEKIKLIKGSKNDYISENGNIYTLYDSENKKFLKKKLYRHTSGYLYCGINMETGKRITKRVHKLVAIHFIDNDDIQNKTIVGHKDNNKENNTKSNLYWTTISENTKKAFDDGLIVNAKGYDDSQSFKVAAFDNVGNLVGYFGSSKECSKALGVSASTIQRQCRGVFKNKSRCGYNFRFQTESEIAKNKK